MNKKLQINDRRVLKQLSYTRIMTNGNHQKIPIYEYANYFFAETKNNKKKTIR